MQMSLPPLSERAVQSSITKLFRQMSVPYYDTSQPFRALITPGVPDLIVFHPRHGLAFIEVKSVSGRQSKAQQRFQQQCEAAGIRYVLGGVEAVAAWLNAVAGS